MKTLSKPLILLTISAISFISCEEPSRECNIPSMEVAIGDQIWKTENLNVDKFRNGDLIPEAKSAEEWVKAGASGKPVWSCYDNDPANCELYGKIYNWYAVNDPRGLAPEGWKIPSKADFVETIEFLAKKKLEDGSRDENAGKNMKFTNYWIGNFDEPNNGNNSSCFSGLPGGSRNVKSIGEYIKVNDPKSYEVTFEGISENSGWWSSTEGEGYLVWSFGLSSYNDMSYLHALNSDLVSHYVRCIKE
jgi:uncharacterized protein (TIGR02145 family)